MNILHYALGFPPYRSGGLTKYCMDLIEYQISQGDSVGLIWPGTISVIRKVQYIKERKNVNGIRNFEIINPLPVSLDEGILDVKEFCKKGDFNVYVTFLRKINPIVIYIHTLMGLHKEFIDAANQLGIKTIFITHDYFGLCPKVTFYHNDRLCNLNDNKCEECYLCNKGALSNTKIIILQSWLYRKLKNTAIVRMIRKKHRTNFFENDFVYEKVLLEDEEQEKYSIEFCNLRKYYISILESIDLIHFNSTVAENVYKHFISPKQSVVFNITHNSISDRRKEKNFNYEKLRITYLAPQKSFKGFRILLRTLDEIWDDGYKNFELHLYNSSLDNKRRKYIINNAHGYSYDELEAIFDTTDILVAPSLWYETYGFTVLEALSYGVPCLISNHVGAKDIIGNAGIIVEANNIQDLKKRIVELIGNRELLREMNQATFEIKLPSMQVLEHDLRSVLNL